MATKKNKNNNNELDCNLSQDSLNYLQLSKQPFAADILTEETFYNYSALDKIIENLHHQAQFSDLILIIEGPFGSGKTSLFRQLIHAEIENTKLLSIQAEATDTLVQLQQKMSMHLQDLGNANYLDDNLKSLQTFDQTPLVVMDNAHVLSDTTLQELFRYKDQLSHEHATSLKLILFANNGFADTLQNITELDLNHMYVQHMPEHTEKLISELVSHKLKIAGYSGEPLLAESDYQTIEKNGSVMPLNAMHDATLLIEKAITRKLNPPKPLWIKIAAASAITVVIGLGVSIYSGILNLNNLLSNESQYVVDDREIKEVILPETTKKETVQTPNSDDNINNADTFVAEEIQEQNTIQTDEALPENTQLKLAVEKTSTQLESKPEIAAEQKPETTSIKPELKTSDLANTTAIKEDKPALPEIKTFKPVIKKTSSSKNSIQTKPEAQSDSTTEKPRHPALVQLSQIGIHNADWLKQQKNTSWTLQLLGARDPETLLSFSLHHNLSGDAAWYKTWLKAKPYYVLIYGNYANRDTARASIAKLPEKLREIKPWAKSMESVQQTIK